MTGNVPDTPLWARVTCWGHCQADVDLPLRGRRETSRILTAMQTY